MLSGQAWTSFGFREASQKQHGKNYNTPYLELGFERKETASNHKHSGQNKRLQRQRERVLSATKQRILQQQYQMQNDPNDMDNTLYQEYFDIEEYEVLSDDVRMVKQSEIAQPRTKKRSRPMSAVAQTNRHIMQNSQYGLQPKYLSQASNMTPRIRSAPVECCKSSKAKKVSRGTQDTLILPEDIRRHSRSGCEYCPVDCRPVSSSTFNLQSSTGLQATGGPSHFQYYNFDKYIRYQRPRSAIAQRISYLEHTGKRRSPASTPSFSNIVRPCKVYSWLSKSRPTRDLQSPIGQPSVIKEGLRKSSLRVAWAEDHDLQESFSSEYNKPVALDFQKSQIAERQSPTADSWTEDMTGNVEEAEEELYDNNNDNDEQAFNNDDLALAFKPTLEDYHDEVGYDDAEETATGLPLATPTPNLSPSSSFDRIVTSLEREDDEDLKSVKSEEFLDIKTLYSIDQQEIENTILNNSEQEERNCYYLDKQDEQERDNQPVSHRPSLDLLTGRPLYEDTDAMNQIDTFETTDEDVSDEPFSGIQVEIYTPEPLPIKRVPEPYVEVVDIVEPRENLFSPEVVQEVDIDSERSESSSPIPDTTSSPVAEGKSSVAVDRPPVSILKSDYQLKEKSSRVQFDIPHDLETSDVSTEDDTKRLQIETTKPKVEAKHDDEPSIALPIDKVERTFSEDADSKKETPKQKDDVKQIVSENISKPPSGTQVVTPPLKVKPATFPPMPSTTSTLIKTPSVEVAEVKSEEEVKLLYEEPVDEDLQRLLSVPDLYGFDAPLYPPVSVKQKKKKAKAALGGKKKKKKGKKKKKSVQTKPEPPTEPLFSYDPNAADPVEMARQRITEMKQEDKELTSAMTAMKEFDGALKEKMKTHPWLFGRMALSKQICRFFLPMDLRELEGVSPSQYLSRYCVVCKRRQKFYLSVFERQLQKRRVKEVQTDIMKKTLDSKETDIALRKVHDEGIEAEHLNLVRKLVCIRMSDDHPMGVTRIDSKLFCSICALTERIFYSHFVTEDAEEDESFQRQKIEAADFDGLEWRLRNVNISKELRNLLFSL